jgi:hypothetical protein
LLARRVGQVDDVVDGRGEQMDVLAVEGRDEVELSLVIRS